MTFKEKLSLAKKLIAQGAIKTPEEFFALIPRTTLAKYTRSTPERYIKLMDDPSLCMIKDFFDIAEATGLNDKDILDIFYPAALAKRKKRK